MWVGAGFPRRVAAPLEEPASNTLARVRSEPRTRRTASPRPLAPMPFLRLRGFTRARQVTARLRFVAEPPACELSFHGLFPFEITRPLPVACSWGLRRQRSLVRPPFAGFPSGRLSVAPAFADDSGRLCNWRAKCPPDLLAAGLAASSLPFSPARARAAVWATGCPCRRAPPCLRRTCQNQHESTL